MSDIAVANVIKSYGTEEAAFNVLDNVSFGVEQGEFAVIIGADGAGKTTLLNVLGGLEGVNSGQVIVDGEEITGYKPAQLAAYRREKAGFVGRGHNLVANLTAWENVRLAAEMAKKQKTNPTKEVFAMMGLEEKSRLFPAQLSRGDRMRVAIARELVKKPGLLLCDEPVGALDYATSKVILSLLHKLCKAQELTVVMATHNQLVMPMADRIVLLKSGKVVNGAKNFQPVPVERIEW